MNDNNFKVIETVATDNFGVSYGFFENEPSVVREHKGKSLLYEIGDYVVIDLETTGLMPSYDEIIEIGAIRYVNDVEIERYHSFVAPTYPLDDFIINLTGITNEMLQGAPNIESVLPAFLSFVGNSVVVGHNVNFDINFIYDNAANKLNVFFINDFVDTMRIARRCRLDIPNCKLNTLINHFGISATAEHRAIADCVSTQRLYRALKSYVSEHTIVLTVNKRQQFSIAGMSADCDVINQDNPFFGKTVVFTGALCNLTRKQAAQIVANMGGILGDNVTRTTNYLVLGNLDYCSTITNGKSAKQKKAEQLMLSGQDLMILPENVFLSMISEE